MKVKNTKSFMEFCNQIGINDLISKNPSNKFSTNHTTVLIKKDNTKINQVLNTEGKKDKEQELSELKNKVLKIDCSLKETATNLVFSDGNPKSNIMVIGDIPGKEEDRTGKPFTGNAGKLLKLMLSHLDLSENNCYFSNLIFWRPPGNRSPSIEEIKVCLPYTQIHIEIIQPKLLILLGGITAKAVLNSSRNITQMIGESYFYESKKSKIKTKVIFHPSFLLNNPIEKKRTWFELSDMSKTINNE